MQTKQLVIVLVAVALLSAGLGVVITTLRSPREVRVSLDLANGAALDLGRVPGKLEQARIQANENAAIATLRSIAAAQGLKLKKLAVAKTSN